ncbi:hypothetical protein B0H14DRAFT_2593198 [Mycena olivaceomarginata]|nr:hypothetical protein B0H14DRAFT_2593198 [Mycena olivaceomarginata]
MPEVPFQKHAGGGARLVMSHEKMMTNALQRIVDLIASDPDRFILFMPFLGGHHFHNRYRNAVTDLAKQLEQVTGAGGIAIYPPLCRQRQQGELRGPMHHEGGTGLGSQARAYRVQQGPHRPHHQSQHGSTVLVPWSTPLQLHCAALPQPFYVERAGVHIFEQGPLHTTVAHATQNQPSSADKHVFEFMETLYHATWERFRDLFRNTKFASGLVEFTPIGSPNRAAGDNIRRLTLCYICKLEDHRSDTCPYRSLTDFVGVKDIIKPVREGILALVKGKPGVRPHEDAPSSTRGRNQHRRHF